ncbi:MAG: hypothetical protein MZV63_18095 [Marinilabiliales bacterium]|nr:hypothetical protein [Marinilabiliales bacterium]
MHITKAVEAGASGVLREGLGRQRTGEGRHGHLPGQVVLQPGGRGGAARRVPGGRSRGAASPTATRRCRTASARCCS